MLGAAAAVAAHRGRSQAQGGKAVLEAGVLKRFLLFVSALLVLAAVVLYALAWRPAIKAIDPPPRDSFDPVLVSRGQVLAAAGNCGGCHTAVGGAPYAGNVPMHTRFGTIWTSNITPDPLTGIGRWPEQAFARAMRKGVSREGRQLYPAFPYAHFALVDDADLRALYAYLMTRPPVRQSQRPAQLPFPLNWRPLQAGWKLLFVREGQFGPVTGRDSQWNRGAYLAEGLAHCSACHSPRNRFGAERGGTWRYAGGAVGQRYAPPLDARNDAREAWREDALVAYLRQGSGAPRTGTAGMPDATADHAGLAQLPEQDLRAIAAYFADRFGTRDDGPPMRQAAETRAPPR